MLYSYGYCYFPQRRRDAEILRTLPFTTGKYHNPQSLRHLRNNPANDGFVDRAIGEKGGQ